MSEFAKPKPRKRKSGDPLEDIGNSQKKKRCEPRKPKDPKDNDKQVSAFTHKLKYMELQNFMCHKKLELNFGERVTFITGKNGAGKSATMNALNAVFGGGAKDTGKKGRANDWIRRGPSGRQTKAVAKITVNNHGPHTYKPEEYGNEITFERHITQNSSSYYMAGQRGFKKREKVSAKEVKFVGQWFRIQVTNPFTIMTQETIKGFMKCNPKQLFMYFSKGTNIEDLKDLYKRMEILIGEFKVSVTKRDKELKEYLADFRKRMVEIDDIELVRNAKDRMNELEALKLWCDVLPMELHLKGIGKKIKKAKAIADRYEQKVTDKKEEGDGNTAKEYGQKHKDLMQEDKQITDELKEHKAEVDAFNRKRKDDSKTMHEIRWKISSTEKELQKNERSLKHLEGDDPHAEERKKIDTQITSAKLIIERLNSELDHMDDQQLNELKQLKIDEESNKKANFNHLNRATNHLEFLRKENVEINRRSRNAEARWGEKTTEILKDIHNTQWRDQQPIGPVGKFLSVKKEYTEYAGILENTLGKTVRAFITFGNDDYQRLSKILATHYPNPIDRPQIFKQKDARPFTEMSNFRDLRHPKYPSCFKALEYKNHLVMNLLISWQQFNNILLIDDESEAQRLIQSSTENPGGRRYPVGLTIFGGRYKFRSAISGHNCALQASLLTGDFKSAFDRNERDRKQAEREEYLYRRDYEMFIRKIKELDVEIRNLETGKSKKRKQISDLEVKVEGLYQKRALLVGKSDINSRHFLTEIQDGKQKIEEFTEALARLEEEQNEELQDMEAKQLLIQPSKDRLVVIEAELEDIRLKLKGIKEKKRQIDADIKNLVDQLDDQKKKVKDLMDEHEKQTELLGKATLGAETRCPRPKNLLSKNELEIEMSVTSKKMQRDVDISESNYQSKKGEAKQRGSEISNMRKILKAYKKAEIKFDGVVKQRVDGLARIIEFQSRRVTESFNFLCRMGQYRGSCAIDTEGKSITITVVKNQTGDDEATRISLDSRIGKKGNTATLSGGERSISTVMFLLSIWYASNSPFRCIDEFDVFMDAHNKFMATTLLCKFAAENPATQLIFLTPQGLAESQEDLKREHGNIFTFLKLKDPTRNPLPDAAT